jgi:phage antirepressor YoqD-like protein
VRALAALHGIKEHRLAKWMSETLNDDASPTQKLSIKEMPPL